MTAITMLVRVVLMPVLKKCDPLEVEIFPVGRIRSFRDLLDRLPALFDIVRMLQG